MIKLISGNRVGKLRNTVPFILKDVAFFIVLDKNINIIEPFHDKPDPSHPEGLPHVRCQPHLALIQT
jgi:hypothetical protein